MLQLLSVLAPWSNPACAPQDSHHFRYSISPGLQSCAVTSENVTALLMLGWAWHELPPASGQAVEQSAVAGALTSNACAV